MWFPVLLCGVISLGAMAVPAHYPAVMSYPAKAGKGIMVAMSGSFTGNAGNSGNGANSGQNVPAGEPGEAPGIDDFVPSANTNAGNAGNSGGNGGFSLTNMVVPYYPAANFLPGMQSPPGSADINAANTIANMIMTSVANGNGNANAVAPSGKTYGSKSTAAMGNGVNGNTVNVGNAFVDVLPMSTMNVAENEVNANGANGAIADAVNANTMNVKGNGLNQNAVAPRFSMNMFSFGPQKGIKTNANFDLNAGPGLDQGNANVLNTNANALNVNANLNFNANRRNNNGFEFSNNGFNFNGNGFNGNGFNNNGFDFGNNGFNFNNNGFNLNNNGFNFNNNGFNINNNGFDFFNNGLNLNAVAANGVNTNGVGANGNEAAVIDDVMRANKKAKMEDVMRNINGGAPGANNMNFMLMVPVDQGNAGNAGNAMNVNSVMNAMETSGQESAKGPTSGMNMLVHGPDCIIPGQNGNAGSNGNAGATPGSNGTPIFVPGNANTGNTGNEDHGK